MLKILGVMPYHGNYVCVFAQLRTRGKGIRLLLGYIVRLCMVYIGNNQKNTVGLEYGLMEHVFAMRISSMGTAFVDDGWLFEGK